MMYDLQNANSSFTSAMSSHEYKQTHTLNELLLWKRIIINLCCGIISSDTCLSDVVAFECHDPLWRHLVGGRPLTQAP